MRYAICGQCGAEAAHQIAGEKRRLGIQCDKCGASHSVHDEEWLGLDAEARIIGRPWRRVRDDLSGHRPSSGESVSVQSDDL